MGGGRDGGMAWYEYLSDEEAQVVAQALRAVLDGPFLGDDRTFSLLMGMPRSALRSVAGLWPQVGDSLTAYDGVIRSLVNLCVYPHRRDDLWDLHLDWSTSELWQLSGLIRGYAKRYGALQGALPRDRLDDLRRMPVRTLEWMLGHWPAGRDETPSARRLRQELLVVATATPPAA